MTKTPTEEELEEWEAKKKEKAQKPKRRPQKKSGRSVFRLKKIIENKGKGYRGKGKVEGKGEEN